MWRGACAFFGWGRRTEEGGGGGQARQVDHVEPLSTPARCAAVQVPRLHDARATPRDCILASARGPDAAAARGGRDRESEQTTGHVWIVPRSGSESDLLFQLKNKQLCPGFAARAGPGPRRARGPDRAPRGDPHPGPGRARRAAARGTASAAMGRASSGTNVLHISGSGFGAARARGRRPPRPPRHAQMPHTSPQLSPCSPPQDQCNRPMPSAMPIISVHPQHTHYAPGCHQNAPRLTHRPPSHCCVLDSVVRGRRCKEATPTYSEMPIARLLRVGGDTYSMPIMRLSIASWSALALVGVLSTTSPSTIG